MTMDDSLHINRVPAMSRVALGLALATTILSLIAVFAAVANGSTPVSTLVIGFAFVVAIVSIYSIDKRVRAPQRGAQIRPHTAHDHLPPSQRKHRAAT